MKEPLDRTPHPRHPRSRPVSAGLKDGGYVYVRDAEGIIHVAPDRPHMHPKVLGGGQTAMYAGDLTIREGHVIDVTNLSGRFRFDDSEGLLSVADELVRVGLNVEPGAVRLFPFDGTRPTVLR